MEQLKTAVNLKLKISHSVYWFIIAYFAVQIWFNGVLPFVRFQGDALEQILQFAVIAILLHTFRYR
jgi:hypothetical protein